MFDRPFSLFGFPACGHISFLAVTVTTKAVPAQKAHKPGSFPNILYIVYVRITMTSVKRLCE
jgi:hypothetical protein